MAIGFNQLLAIRKNVQGKRLKKPAKWLFPYNLERKYRRLLHKLVRELSLAIREQLVPVYPELLAEVSATYPNNDMSKKDGNLDMTSASCTKNDDFLDRLRGIMLSIQEFINPKVKETITEMELIATEISNFNQQQFEKVNKSVFGIDIFVDQPFLRDQLELFSRQNAQLITSLPEQDLLQVAGIVERGLQEGSRFTLVAQDIQKRFGITRRRANLISRDQTTKLNASLTKLRQESAGITEYIWQTSGDERVRPTHRANDGKKFKWDNPPKITGHPGTDINCRCVAIPVMEGVIE
jgi:SPP1 gp7 family putative phage head morphogenesis protein